MSEPGDFWQRADEAFDRALDLSAGDRARFLAELSAADPKLHAEVARLLGAHDRSGDFLADSAAEFGASLLADFFPSTPDLPTGTRVGAYSILERTGSGGMGIVYKARDERLDRFVALKFLATDPDADEDARSRLLSEARIASSLDHPGIAVVHEIAETDDHGVFVAMAFYEGATLKERLRDGPLPLESCIDLATQIANALAAAHRHGIVHRDIKPANVIVTHEGVAKIVDFGIARIGVVGATPAGESVRGSPGYMSPEQRGGGEVDARADVWSFGVLLHEMLTGKRPRDDSAFGAGVPAAFRPLIARCLEPDVEERYADASVLLADLQAAASDPSGMRARRRWPMAAAAAGVLALAAATALTMLDRSPSSPPAAIATSRDPLPGIEVTTTSLAAYASYQEGRRRYATGDYQGAVPEFDIALSEDPTFAMAAHYRWIARHRLGLPLPPEAVGELARLSGGLSQPERHAIQEAWEEAGTAPPVSLVDTRPEADPTDYWGYYRRGRERVERGDALGALPDFRKAVELAPPDRDGEAASCRACDALAALAGAYATVDSLVAGERVAREWVQREPGSARAWRSLAAVLVTLQRYEEAAEANRRAIELSPGHPEDAVFAATSRIVRADFAEADRLLADLMRDAPTVVRAEAAWFQTINLRYQGRLDEALAAIEQYAVAAPEDPNGARLHRAQVLLEMGRAAEAAAMFDSSASLASTHRSSSGAARDEAWSLTHRASVAAVAGDTTLLASLADSIESVGSRSWFARDPLLHHHVRGLLFVARGDLEAAAAAFRRAIFTPTFGYTRTNVELGRVLITLGRPLEAVAVLQPALHGGLEASNLYNTQTELHELLGRAWRAAGRPDSAAVHDEWVLRAWERADPAFEERRNAVRRRAQADTRSHPGF